jgi:hypothetical protein
VSAPEDWFTPVEHEMGGDPSRPVQWYVLIKAMEAYRLGTGMGLAHTWSLVHDGNFDGALASFRDTVGGPDATNMLLPPGEQRTLVRYLRLADGAA